MFWHSRDFLLVLSPLTRCVCVCVCDNLMPWTITFQLILKVPSEPPGIATSASHRGWVYFTTHGAPWSSRSDLRALLLSVVVFVLVCAKVTEDSVCVCVWSQLTTDAREQIPSHVYDAGSKMFWEVAGESVFITRSSCASDFFDLFFVLLLFFSQPLLQFLHSNRRNCDTVCDEPLSLWQTWRSSHFSACTPFLDFLSSSPFLVPLFLRPDTQAGGMRLEESRQPAFTKMRPLCFWSLRFKVKPIKYIYIYLHASSFLLLLHISFMTRWGRFLGHRPEETRRHTIERWVVGGVKGQTPYTQAAGTLLPSGGVNEDRLVAVTLSRHGL